MLSARAEVTSGIGAVRALMTLCWNNIWCAGVMFAVAHCNLAAGAEAPEFERDIAPLVVTHCLDCHQPNKRSGGLDLSTRARLITGGEQGPAVQFDNPDKSLLLARITSGEMPPADAKDRSPLSPDQINTLTAWITAGAPWPDGRQLGIHEKPLDLAKAQTFWSFQPVRRPQVPARQADERAENPIDRFIGEQLAAKGLSLAPPAARQDLLRRVSLDVRGLPPSLHDQEEFLSDAAPDAYERLIDRLLADPAYGERWARYWLDLVRYADSNGYERDGPKPSVWRYRDYVISAFNGDKPYDRFMVEQIAGDELEDATTETLIATGFHALGTWNDEVDPLEAPQYRADELDDMIRTTAQSFLGLTLGCARCHNHKFDPLTMVDYYSLAAILAPLKRPNKGRIDRAVPIGTPEQIAAQIARYEEISQLDKRLLELNTQKPPDADEQKAAIRQRQRQLRTETPDLPGAYRCYENPCDVPPTYLLLSGRASSPGPLMQPQVPAVLATQQPIFPANGPQSTLRRLTLARWIASAENPLTARVIVNRVWQHHFGEGIVATPSDFGSMGARPTHPELLDWLSDWLVYDAEWSLKKLHRLILTSETYRQATILNPKSIDPENKLLWHFPYRRLDAEAIRDSMLAVAGNLDRTMYGSAVYFPIQAAAIEAHTDKQAAWKASPEPAINRRTVYAFVKRTLLVPMLETLDFCDTTQSTERRAITTIAPQALTLFNGEFVNRQAERFAERLAREASGDLDRQLDLAYRLALCRLPTDAERGAIRRFFESQALPTNQQAALVQVCRVILNLNEFVYPN
jgi:mono/diheme cytochrome c family protein